MIKFEKEVTGLVPDPGVRPGAKCPGDARFSPALVRVRAANSQVRSG